MGQKTKLRLLLTIAREFNGVSEGERQSQILLINLKLNNSKTLHDNG
jgi:hypothetical protein